MVFFFYILETIRGYTLRKSIWYFFTILFGTGFCSRFRLEEIRNQGIFGYPVPITFKPVGVRYIFVKKLSLGGL